MVDEEDPCASLARKERRDSDESDCFVRIWIVTERNPYLESQY